MNFFGKPKAALAAATVAATLLSAPAQALVLANGNYVEYDFDFSALIDATHPSSGLLIMQRYSGDILSGRDKVRLDVFNNSLGAPVVELVDQTIVTLDTFGPTSAWGLQIYANSEGFETLMKKVKGSYRITVLDGSVNLSEASVTYRDARGDDLTRINFREEIPEPGTPSLLLAGFAACAWIGRKLRSGAVRNRRSTGLTA